MAVHSKSHICQCLSRLLTLRRHSTVTVSGDRCKTGEEFVDGVLGLARGLLELGLTAGDVVAICAFNSDSYLEWLLAVAYIGGITAPLNYRWSFEESRRALEVVQPAMLVVDDCCTWYSQLQEKPVLSVRWCVFMDSYSSFSSKIENVLTTELLSKRFLKFPHLSYCWAPDSVAIICFTSGTTGRPKGVAISHTSFLVQSLVKIATVSYNENDVYLHTAPLCHIGGISSAMAMLMAGGCHVLIPKFEAQLGVEAIMEYGVTSLITVPAIMADMISFIRLNKTWMKCQSMKKILNGGGSLSVELIKSAAKIFPNAKLLSAYGMTETCSSLTFMILYDPNLDPHTNETDPNRELVYQTNLGICVGKPAPNVEIMITPEGSSNIGRILTRGSHVMLRYWGTSQTASMESNHHLQLRQEEWFDTGDIGRIDGSGNLWLIGRKSGRIKSGGENVYPEEVEAVLSQHPGVRGVVVVGLPHTRLNEMVIACVQVRGGWIWKTDSSVDQFATNSLFHISDKDLKMFCEQKNLSRFKIPKAFMVWRKAFPLTSTGKLKRDQVRREAMLLSQTLPSKI